MIHELKCWPGFFEALADGRKTHEVRYDDRNFQVGDILKISKWDPSSSCFVEPYKPLVFEVTHILKGEKWGIRDGFADLSIKLVPEDKP